MDYGGDFADFVEGFAPAASVPYLAAVARLERARVQAYHAADSQPLTADQLAAALGSQGFWLSIAAFFALGLGLAFTPCVFPMYPILTGIIAGAGQHLSTRRAFLLGCVLERFVARHVSINGFTQTQVHSTGRGDILSGRPRCGTRAIL